MSLKPLHLLAALAIPLMGMNGWGGCRSMFHPVLPDCLDDPDSAIVDATSGQRSYTLDNADCVDAQGVTWDIAYDEGENGIELDGAGPAGWVGGRIVGDYQPGVAVYECDSTHCPGGSCPSPCKPYHTTAGIQFSDGGPEVDFSDLCIKHWGDGISMRDDSGDITVDGIHIQETLDDAIENDFATGSVTVTDSLFERIAQGFATRLRSSASGSWSGHTWAIIDSTIWVRRPGNWYKEGSDPGERAPAVFKLNGDDNQPNHRLVRSWFIMERDGGELLPTVDSVIECSGNVALLAGTPSENADLLADGGDGDGLNNGQRLAALAHCFTVHQRTSGETQDEFYLRTGLTQRISDWKATHPGSCD